MLWILLYIHLEHMSKPATSWFANKQTGMSFHLLRHFLFHLANLIIHCRGKNSKLDKISTKIQSYKSEEENNRIDQGETKENFNFTCRIFINYGISKNKKLSASHIAHKFRHFSTRLRLCESCCLFSLSYTFRSFCEFQQIMMSVSTIFRFIIIVDTHSVTDTHIHTL